MSTTRRTNLGDMGIGEADSKVTDSQQVWWPQALRVNQEATLRATLTPQSATNPRTTTCRWSVLRTNFCQPGRCCLVAHNRAFRESGTGTLLVENGDDHWFSSALVRSCTGGPGRVEQACTGLGAGRRDLLSLPSMFPEIGARSRPRDRP